MQIKCGCPRRTSVPSKPDTILFPSTEINWHQLEKWIKERFKSNAFNTCLHQPLQAMAGKPLNITFVPGATPTAVHAPIPVSHHWKKRVKQDIDRDVATVHAPIPVSHHWKKRVKQDTDRDVALGIIEAVPVGTPTTWCLRIVVTPKK